MGYLLRVFVFSTLFFLSLTQTPSAQTCQWQLAMSWPEGTPMLHNGAKRFASNVEKMSVGVGRMRIIVDTPGRHKASLGIFDMVRSGAYEMGHTASYYYKDRHC